MSQEIKFHIIFRDSRIQSYRLRKQRYDKETKILRQLSRRSAETWEKIQLMDFDVNIFE